MKAISNKNGALDVGLKWNLKQFGDAFEAFSSCAEGRLMTHIFAGGNFFFSTQFAALTMVSFSRTCHFLFLVRL